MAKKLPQSTTFTVTIPHADSVKPRVLMTKIKYHLDNFGEGTFWDEKTNQATVGKIKVEQA